MKIDLQKRPTKGTYKRDLLKRTNLSTTTSRLERAAAFFFTTPRNNANIQHPGIMQVYPPVKLALAMTLLELHWILPDPKVFCVRQEDGRGVKRGS